MLIYSSQSYTIKLTVMIARSQEERRQRLAATATPAATAATTATTATATAAGSGGGDDDDLLEILEDRDGDVAMPPLGHLGPGVFK